MMTAMYKRSIAMPVRRSAGLHRLARRQNECTAETPRVRAAQQCPETRYVLATVF